MLQASLYMHADKVKWEARTKNDAAYCRTVTRSTLGTWFWSLEISCQLKDFMSDEPAVLDIEKHDTIPPRVWDKIWLRLDARLYALADNLTSTNSTHPTVVGEFGLYNPLGLEGRPTYTKSLANNLRKTRQRAALAAIAPPPREFLQSIPLAAPTDKVGTSGHRYASEACSPQDKTKSKGVPSTDHQLADILEDGETEYETLPEALPTQFKIGKKHLKVRYTGALRIPYQRLMSASAPNHGASKRPRQGGFPGRTQAWTSTLGGL